MKRRILGVFGLAAVLAVSVVAAEFGYPVDGQAWYSIKWDFTPTPEMKGAVWRLVRAEVNGARVRDFVLYQDGRELAANEVKGDLPFGVRLRSSWRPNALYKAGLVLEDIKSGKKASLAAEAKSPAGKGYWDPAWQNYFSLILSEEDGVARQAYPVHATVGIMSRYLRSGDEIRVVKAEKKDGDVSYREVPSQVYDIITWNDPKVLGVVEKDAATGQPMTRYHPTTTLSVAFLADLQPREKATFLVFYNNPKARKPSYKGALTVKKGKGYGRTVENGFYKIVLQEKSGVIHEIVEKTTKIQLEHKLETNGAIHWNPDVFSPPHAWYHSSDWSDPKATEVVGPVFYSLKLEGRLPQPPGIKVSLKYHFYAGSPVVMVESATEIEEDIFVMALRNAEVVFNKAVFSQAAFPRAGKVEVLDFASSRMHPDHAAVLRPDTPWISLFDKGKGIGFAVLYLDLATPSLRGGQASLQQPYIYIQHGPWYYISRGFVYSFGSNNQTRMLPVAGGSVYYDRNAWLAFPFPKDQSLGDYLDRFSAMLKHPVAIREEFETYAESPEGWVVPILTEPFEEGVKDALGGKERRK